MIYAWSSINRGYFHQDDAESVVETLKNLNDKQLNSAVKLLSQADRELVKLAIMILKDENVCDDGGAWTSPFAVASEPGVPNNSSISIQKRCLEVKNRILLLKNKDDIEETGNKVMHIFRSFLKGFGNLFFGRINSKNLTDQIKKTELREANYNKTDNHFEDDLINYFWKKASIEVDQFG